MINAGGHWLIALSMLLLLLRAACREFCSTETFNAECDVGSVIVIQNARYGRMRLNRCIKVNFGFIGCSMDVTHILDQRCSARRECTVGIPDSALDANTPCITDLTRYLEASYVCVPVYKAASHACIQHGRLSVTSSLGYIVGSSSADTVASSHDCPYIISVPEGQRINLTLMDFTAHLRRADSATNGVTPPSNACHRFAAVTDITGETRKDICATNKRITTVLTSTGNSLELRIPDRALTKQAHFMFKYEAVGCANLAVDTDQWQRRSGMLVTLGCKNNDREWNLHCQGNEWVGQLGNCTVKAVTLPGPVDDFDQKQKHGDSDTDNMNPTESFLPKGFAVFLIVLIALLVGLCVVVFGLIISKRRKFLQSRASDQNNTTALASATQHMYPAYPDTKDIPSRYGSREEIEFDIYKHHGCPNAHMLVNAQDGQATNQPCYNDYLYTLRRDTVQDSSNLTQQQHREGRDAGCETTAKRCTCKTYDSPTELTTTQTTKSNVFNRATLGEWENNSLLMNDHEPDLITLKRQDTEHNG